MRPSASSAREEAHAFFALPARLAPGLAHPEACLALLSPLRLAFADTRCTCLNKVQGYIHTRRPEQASLLSSTSPESRALFTSLARQDHLSTHELGKYPLQPRPCSLCRSYAISTIPSTSRNYVPTLRDQVSDTSVSQRNPRMLRSSQPFRSAFPFRLTASLHPSLQANTSRKALSSTVP